MIDCLRRIFITRTYGAFMNLDIVDLERSREEPLPLAKRHCKAPVMFEDVVLAIGDIIFKSMQWYELSALALTSRKWQVLTANAPFWREICAKAGLALNEGSACENFARGLDEHRPGALLASIRYHCECEQIFYPQIRWRVLAECQYALMHEDLEEAEKIEIEKRIHYLLTFGSALDGDYFLTPVTEIVEDLKVLILHGPSPIMRAQAKILLVWIYLQGIFGDPLRTQLVDMLQDLRVDASLPDWIKAQAKVMLARPQLELSPDQAIPLFNSSQLYTSWNGWVKFQSDFCGLYWNGLLCHRSRDQIDEQTVRLCKKILEGKWALPNERTRTIKILAEIKNSSTLIDSQEFLAQIKLLKQKGNSNLLHLYIAELRLKDRIGEMTDAEAIDQLQKIRMDSNIRPPIKEEAAFILARARMDNLTDKITDREAFEILDSLNKNSSDTRLKAQSHYLMAKMRFFQRTVRLTQGDCINMLEAIIASDYFAKNKIFAAEVEKLLGSLKE